MTESRHRHCNMRSCSTCAFTHLWNSWYCHYLFCQILRHKGYGKWEQSNEEEQGTPPNLRSLTSILSLCVHVCVSKFWSNCYYSMFFLCYLFSEVAARFPDSTRWMTPNSALYLKTCWWRTFIFFLWENLILTFRVALDVTPHKM